MTAPARGMGPGARPGMKPKHQRLVLLAAALVALGGATALGLSAVGDTATYFYSPSDVAQKGVEPGEPIRLGGMVQSGSVRRLDDGVTLAFVVTDYARTLPVRYRGIVPDLFREEQGVVAEGKLGRDGIFQADMLLARHDENYMPPEVADSLHKSPSLEVAP
jgi:cytochrome c-type biogenesis protein CcmE